jgi:hypothetical protein
MAKRMTPEEIQAAIHAQAQATGVHIRQTYGDHIGWNELLRILADPSCARFPCEVQFDAQPLLPGEFAHPEPKGTRPEEGFTICVHPRFGDQPDMVPYLVLYQLVVVNYGELATPDDAETLGCEALGLPKEDYYLTLCRLADQLGTPAAA